MKFEKPDKQAFLKILPITVRMLYYWHFSYHFSKNFGMIPGVFVGLVCIGAEAAIYWIVTLRDEVYKQRLLLNELIQLEISHQEAMMKFHKLSRSPEEIQEFLRKN